MTGDTVETFRGYPVQRRTFQVAGRRYVLLGPANYEALIDDPRVVARFEQDEYLPYWAEFWPAALLLAEEVAAWGTAPPDPPLVLELGCGLGLASLVAAAHGYPVIASDYDEDALEFVKASARHNGLPEPRTLRIDWREAQPGLSAGRIVAAEVLYEQRNLVPVARFISQHLDPSGFALVCDAGRPTADAFADVACDQGLAAVVEPREHSGQPPIRARLFRLVHRPAG